MGLTVVLIGIDGALAKSVYNALTASTSKLNVGKIKVITGSQPTQPLPQVEYIIGDASNQEEALTLAQRVPSGVAHHMQEWHRKLYAK